MECKWLRVTPSLTKGIEIINQLEDSKFEQFLKRISTKLNNQLTHIFTDEEKQKLLKIFKQDENNLNLIIKTTVYLLKRMFKFIIKPMNLKSNLNSIGLTDVKSELFVKVWSVETKVVFDQIGNEISYQDNDLNMSWKLCAELSSSYQKKTKVPKAYLTLATTKNNQELELTHPELYSMYLQIEALQMELDLIM